MKTRWICLAAGMAMALPNLSCDEKTAEAKAEKRPATEQAAPAAPAPEPAAPAKPQPKEAEKQLVEVAIGTVGNQMKFTEETLTVKEGTRVHLTLTNASTLEVLPHNWVLVKAGTEAAVAAAGLAKGEAAGYVAPGPDVLAYTPLAGPKGTAEVTFDAPPVGKYPYICTVPGHYVVMKGTLVVEK